MTLLVTLASVYCSSCKQKSSVEFPKPINYVAFHLKYMLDHECPNCESSDCLILQEKGVNNSGE
jgi:hypothetical protein